MPSLTSTLDPADSIDDEILQLLNEEINSQGQIVPNEGPKTQDAREAFEAFDVEDFDIDDFDAENLNTEDFGVNEPQEQETTPKVIVLDEEVEGGEGHEREEALDDTEGQDITTKPPFGSYPSRTTLETALHAFTAQAGFDVSKGLGKEKNQQGEIFKWMLGCTRRGDGPKNTRRYEEKDRVRLGRGSAACGCKAAFIMRADDLNNINGPWSLRPKRGLHTYYHNHPALDKNTFAGHRRRFRNDLAVLEVAKSAFRIGSGAARTTALIQEQHTTSLILRKDINNLNASFKKDSLSIFTPVEAVLKLLEVEGFFFRNSVDNEGRLNQLLLAHPDSLNLLRKAPEVLTMDCTFKTNKYNRPILNIVATDANNSTIQVALGFVRGERKEDYNEILN